MRELEGMILKNTSELEIILPSKKSELVDRIIETQNRYVEGRMEMEKRKIGGMISAMVRVGKTEDECSLFGSPCIRKSNLFERSNWKTSEPEFVSIYEPEVLDLLIFMGVKDGHIAFHDGRRWMTGDTLGYHLQEDVALTLTQKGREIYNSAIWREAYFS